MKADTTTARSAIATLCFTSALISSLAQAQGVSPASCSRIAERDGRLACYDRLYPPAGGGMAAVSPSVPAVAATGPAPAPAQAKDAAFGLPAKPQAVSSASAQLVSRINGEVTGWVPGTRFRLANGQLWAIDESSRTGGYALRDPVVRVVEGTFGGYFLEIEGISKTPRVKRVE